MRRKRERVLWVGRYVVSRRSLVVGKSLDHGSCGIPPPLRLRSGQAFAHRTRKDAHPRFVMSRRSAWVLRFAQDDNSAAECLRPWPPSLRCFSPGRFIGGCGFFRLEYDRGGQQDSDQAEADQGEKRDHEDRHGVLLIAQTLGRVRRGFRDCDHSFA